MWLERAYPLLYGSYTKTKNNKEGPMWSMSAFQIICWALNCTFLLQFVTSNYNMTLTLNI